MKANCLRAVGAGRREKAARGEGPLTTWGPPWLRFDKATKAWVVIEERAEAVRLMFDLLLAGMGVTSISRELTRRGIAPFAKNSKGWNTGSVRYILGSPSTFGTLVPKAVVWEGKKKKYVEKEPVPNAFPPVITAVKLAMTNRTPSVKETPAAASFQNVFHRLAYCGTCGAIAHSVSKQTRRCAGGNPRRALVCSNGRYGRPTPSGECCGYTSIRLDELEAALIRHAEEVFVDRLDYGDSSLAKELAAVEANIEGLETGIETLSEGYQRSRSSTLLDALVAAEAELRTLMARRSALADEVGATASDLVAARMATVRTLLANAGRAEVDASEDGRRKAAARSAGIPAEDRPKLHTALKQLVSRVELHAKDGYMVLRWRHGGDATVFFSFPAEA